mmetsp:Transcript_9622/g.13135  ORF Transcript_9622/g.13135 Transcript_9622/m.13135 type:complete len:151 (-) Transcript_9622:94-546(-)
MILVLGRREVAEAHHCHHSFLGCLSLHFCFLLFYACRSLSRFLILLCLISVALLNALDLFISASSSLFFLESDHLLPSQRLGDNICILIAIARAPAVLLSALVRPGPGASALSLATAAMVVLPSIVALVLLEMLPTRRASSWGSLQRGRP